jgi:uroporphyrinogen decarboxylase
MAMATQEEWLSAHYDKVEYWTTQIAMNLTKLEIDSLWFGEDFGTQTTTLMSPEMWRQTFKPLFLK